MSDLHDHITALEEARYSAMLSADTAILEDILASNLHYMHSTATADGKASYIEKVANGQIRYLDIDASDVEVRVHSSYALVFGHLRAEVVSGGEARSLNSRYLAIWRQEEDRWRFEAFSPTPLP